MVSVIMWKGFQLIFYEVKSTLVLLPAKLMIMQCRQLPITRGERGKKKGKGRVEGGGREKGGRREMGKGEEGKRGERGIEGEKEEGREGREGKGGRERERDRQRGKEGCEPNAWHSKEAAFKSFGWDADLQNLWTHNSLAYKACWRHRCAQKGLAE